MTIENSARSLSMSELSSELSKICINNVARESIQARQAAAATYYDKVVDDELQVGELMYILAPRNKSKKLALKWFSASEVVKCCHPSYWSVTTQSGSLLTFEASPSRCKYPSRTRST